MKDLFH